MFGDNLCLFEQTDTLKFLSAKLGVVMIDVKRTIAIDLQTFGEVRRKTRNQHRDEYIEEELGFPNFTIENRHYTRKDFELLNFKGYLLKVSMLEPDPKERPQDIMPCVIYLHANASSRIEGLHIRRFLLKRNINLCVFDFQGSGLSEGEYISLGYHEKHQVKNIVDFVEKYPGVGKIGLWGRSMGAATTLIYANMDKRIKANSENRPSRP